MSEIERRRLYTEATIESLRHRLSYSAGVLDKVGCIYLTGSFGRLEATEGSDIDVFISSQGDHKERNVSRLQEIKIKADLIHATEALHLPEFDGDGDYLQLFPEEHLIRSIGSQSDDYENTFTARLLLLLEGRALIGQAFFDALRRKIIDAYWRDHAGHESEFVPAFFANDVLRLWRTFCVNYEARTSEETDDKRAKRRSKNYRLRHTRIMTCFSFLAMLLAAEKKGRSIDPELALGISNLTPVDRISRLRDDAVRPAENVLDLYERSLATSAAPGFKTQFLDDQYNLKRRVESREFSEAFFVLLTEVGESTTLLKRLLV